MHEVKTKKYRGSLFLKFAVFCFAAFFIVSLINQQIQISEKQQQLDELHSEIKIQQIKNDDLKYEYDNEGDMADYAEKAARRDFNYAKPQEKVFVIVGGSD